MGKCANNSARQTRSTEATCVSASQPATCLLSPSVRSDTNSSTLSHGPAPDPLTTARFNDCVCYQNCDCPAARLCQRATDGCRLRLVQCSLAPNWCSHLHLGSRANFIRVHKLSSLSSSYNTYTFLLTFYAPCFKLTVS